MNQNIFKNLKRISQEYSRGTNLIQFIRNELKITSPEIDPIITSYDFQSGSYIEFAAENSSYINSYTQLIADTINKLDLNGPITVLEAGCGELTTFSNVVNKITHNISGLFAFDASLSRIHLGKEYFHKTVDKKVESHFFVADLFNIPMTDNSVDVIYTSHALEPNGGKEKEAINELLRATKQYLVLFEPSYENACPEGQKRMETHGYIKNLKKIIEENKTAELLGYFEVEAPASKLNPTWIHIIRKTGVKDSRPSKPQFMCPLTQEIITQGRDHFFVPKMLSYPVVHDIPYLMSSHAILSSKV